MGAHKGAAGLQPAPKPPKEKLKRADFVDIMISKVLRNFPLQPKSATQVS
jgi:hypothetical protein